MRQGRDIVVWEAVHAASQHPPDRSQQWLELYQVDFKASRVFLSLTEEQQEEIRRQGGLGSGNTSRKLIARIMKTCKWWTLKNLVANDASQGPPSPPEQAVVDAAAATSPTALSENDSDSDGWGDWQPEGTDSLASGASFAHFKGDGKGSLGTTILAKRPRTPFRQPRQECVSRKQENTLPPTMSGSMVYSMDGTGRMMIMLLFPDKQLPTYVCTLDLSGAHK